MESEGDGMINYQGNTVWLVTFSRNGVPESPEVFSNKKAAIESFSGYVVDCGGEPDAIDFNSYVMTDWYSDDDDDIVIRMFETKVNHKA